LGVCRKKKGEKRRTREKMGESVCKITQFRFTKEKEKKITIQTHKKSKHQKLNSDKNKSAYKKISVFYALLSGCFLPHPQCPRLSVC
jgi:hypothetical protein